MRRVILLDDKYLESSEFYSKRYHNFSTIVIGPIVIFVLLLLISSIFVKKQITLKTTGEITAVKPLAPIQSTSSNAIASINMSEGKVIHKNELLIRYENTTTTTKIRLLRHQNSQLKKRCKAIETMKLGIQQDANTFKNPDQFGYSNLLSDYLNNYIFLQNQAAIDTDNTTQATNSYQNQVNQLNKLITTYQNKLADYENLQGAIRNNSSLNKDNSLSSIYDNYQHQINDASAEEVATMKNQFDTSLQNQKDQVEINLQNFRLEQAAASKDETQKSLMLNNMISEFQQKVSDYNEVINSINNNVSVGSSNSQFNLVKNYQDQIVGESTSKINTLKGNLISQIENEKSQFQSALENFELQQAQLTNGENIENVQAKDTAQIERVKQQTLSSANKEKVIYKHQLEENQAQLDIYTETGKDNVLKAPADGILHKTAKIENIKYIPKGATIAEVYPSIKNSHSVGIDSYVNSTDAVNLRAGQKVVFKLASSAPHAITLTGKIYKVDSAATNYHGLSVFKVHSVVSINKISKKNIKYGLQGNVHYVTGKKTYFNFFKDIVMNN